MSKAAGGDEQRTDDSLLITSIVEDAAADLKGALAEYWPSEGFNEMAEANAVGALGRAFGRANFYVFHEVQCRKDRIGRVDLLALSSDRSACVAVEAKRVYNGAQADAVVRDWDRLGVTRLARQYGAPQAKSQYRMVIATSWQPFVRAWWHGDKNSPAWSPPEWHGRAAMAAGCRADSLRLQTDTQWGDQWLLYAFGPRDGSYFA